ncbi:MAG: HD domain-containing protein [Acidobacteriota bacterium]|jgi:HD-GYP domain-containing protein (c-di-GMP phosphodiesterase class II)
MARILLVAEERARAREVRALLRMDDHDVEVVRRPGTWRSGEQAFQPHLIVAATEEAGTVVDHRGRSSRGFLPPLLFVHEESDRVAGQHAEDRLIDWLFSPFGSDELLARVDALAAIHRVLHGEPADPPPPEPGPFARLWRGKRGPSRSDHRPVVPRMQVRDRLAEWTDRRDSFAEGHGERVGHLCAGLVEAMGLVGEEADTLLRAAALHDIGKAALPAELLHRRAPLTDEQRRNIRTHSRRGAALVRLLEPSEPLVDAVLCHHERLDGSGYLGRKGDQVSRVARILAVAECFDAMTTSRVGDRLDTEEALRWLASRRAEFDADCVAALADRLKPRPDVIPLSPIDLPPLP